MKRTATLCLAIVSLLALGTTAWAAEAPAPAPESPSTEAPGPETGSSEAAPAQDELPALTPAPAEQSWCAVLHSPSVTDCQNDCYANDCGFDHWNSSTCDCYCGYRF